MPASMEIRNSAVRQGKHDFDGCMKIKNPLHPITAAEGDFLWIVSTRQFLACLRVELPTDRELTVLEQVIHFKSVFIV